LADLIQYTLENLDKAPLYFIAAMSVLIIGRLNKIVYLLEENKKAKGTRNKDM
jgi:hypothetical protein